MPDYFAQALTAIEGFEGSIPWMYRDTAGKVTTAVGLMLPDAGAAVKLSFAHANGAATAQEIEAEFARVDGLPMGRPALFYREAGGPELPQAEIDSLLQTVVTGFEGELRRGFTAYDGFPDNVKIALLDMIYNLGPTGLLLGFPRFVAAVGAGNWTAAAGESERRGISAARNTWTRNMLLGAVVSSISAGGESGLKRFGYGVLGMGAAVVQRLRGK